MAPILLISVLVVKQLIIYHVFIIIAFYTEASLLLIARREARPKMPAVAMRLLRDVFSRQDTDIK